MMSPSCPAATVCPYLQVHSTSCHFDSGSSRDALTAQHRHNARADCGLDTEEQTASCQVICVIQMCTRHALICQLAVKLSLVSFMASSLLWNRMQLLSHPLAMNGNVHQAEIHRNGSAACHRFTGDDFGAINASDQPVLVRQRTS